MSADQELLNRGRGGGQACLLWALSPQPLSEWTWGWGAGLALGGVGWSCLAPVLSELLHSGAYHSGLSRELRVLSAHREGPELSEPALLILAGGEGAGQIQSLLPAPLDSLPLLLGTAPPPHFRSGPWASRGAFSPKQDMWGWGGASCNQSWRSAPAPREACLEQQGPELP